MSKNSGSTSHRSAFLTRCGCRMAVMTHFRIETITGNVRAANRLTFRSGDRRQDVQLTPEGPPLGGRIVIEHTGVDGGVRRVELQDGPELLGDCWTWVLESPTGLVTAWRGAHTSIRGDEDVRTDVYAASAVARIVL